jgi:hypothetical protein
MSRRAKEASSLIARQLVSSWIKELQDSKTTPHGLPEDILVNALDGYGTENLSWPFVRSKAQDFLNYVSAHVSDCTIRHIFRRPIGRKEPAGSVSIYRLMDGSLRQAETLFGARVYTFTFWRSGLWFLSTTDPLYTTNHLHQRLVERSSTRHEFLAEAQDSLSILWPTLLELGQMRQRLGRQGNVTNFVTPFADGLTFGDVQKFDFTDEVLNAAAPTMIDFKYGLALEQKLFDYFSSQGMRVMVVARTFVGSNQLKDTQCRLKATLDRYVHRHRAVLECARYNTRLAFSADAPYGPAHRNLFCGPAARLIADFRKAMAELDAITSSEDWSIEISRQIENKSRHLGATPGSKMKR